MKKNTSKIIYIKHKQILVPKFKYAFHRLIKTFDENAELRSIWFAFIDTCSHLRCLSVDHQALSNYLFSLPQNQTFSYLLQKVTSLRRDFFKLLPKFFLQLANFSSKRQPITSLYLGLGSKRTRSFLGCMSPKSEFNAFKWNKLCTRSVYKLRKSRASVNTQISRLLLLKGEVGSTFKIQTTKFNFVGF